MGATYTRQSTYTDGDIIQASDTNNEFDQLLAAFASSTGHTHDGTTGEGGPVTKLLGTAITIGDGTSGTDITVTFDGETNDGELKWMEDEDYFEFSDDLLIASTEKIQFRDTAIYINSSTDGQLDLVADSEIQIAATTIDINGAVDVSGNLSVGGNLDVTGSFDMSDANITNIGSIALDTITNDGTDITLDSSGDIILDAGGANVTIKDDGTSILDIANSSSDAVLTVSTADKNFTIKGTDSSSLITALDIDMALAGKATFNGDVVIGGDLTISGDDLTMATNTSGALLIADGTNFNPTVVGDLSEISTVANDDVFLAVDTSGGGLKKITRSAIVSGLAASGAISNVVEDTSPQLGGDLDTNSFDIIIDDAHSINDENGNEQIIFQTTSSAVNQFDVTNAATGNAPKLSATGGDSNIDFELEAKGTGHLTVRGNTNAGAIQFNCESNSHGQIVQSQPHSAAVTNTMLLPAGSSSTLVSLVSTDTLTNKTLTSPKINEDVAVTATATELNILDGVTTTTAEINLIDGGTARGTTAVASGDGILINDGGTMRMTNVDTVSTYFAGHSVGGSNIVTTGALNSGSITSGFGTIDTGSSTITTTGLISGGSLDIDNVLINGTTIGHTDDTDLITVADGLVTVAGEISVTTLDIGGTNVTATAAELNLLDGGTSVGGSITLADADGFVVNDGGTMKTIPATDVKTYAAGSAATKGFAIAMAIVFG